MKKYIKFIIIFVGVLLILFLLGLIYFKVAFISRREVKDIIISDIGSRDVYFNDIDFELIEGDYEVEVYYQNRKYQYIIDSKSGDIIFSNFKTDSVINSNSNSIDITEAKEIALSNAGVDSINAKFLKERADYDDGRLVYEIEFTYNDFKYEYKIDSLSKEIIEFDKESIYD